MTRRMLTAVANPHLDILGHCTGRMVSSRPAPSVTRPQVTGGIGLAPGARATSTRTRCSPPAPSTTPPSRSTARPERQDPPKRLIRPAALEAGCRFAIDTDAHAPGQLDWLANGTVRAEQAGITADRVINTRRADELGRPAS